MATTLGDNTIRADTGFSRRFNFRLFQQYPSKPVKLEPLGNVLRVVVVIIAVLVVIGILLDIAGMPIGGWRLSAMGAVA